VAEGTRLAILIPTNIAAFAAERQLERAAGGGFVPHMGDKPAKRRLSALFRGGNEDGRRALHPGEVGMDRFMYLSFELMPRPVALASGTLKVF
jgi:hypothetical protein